MKFSQTLIFNNVQIEWLAENQCIEIENPMSFFFFGQKAQHRKIHLIFEQKKSVIQKNSNIPHLTC